MAGWYATRTLPRSAKLVIALAVLAVVLVAAVPVAFFIGLILMLFGHVIGGLALFGGSILAAIGAIALAAVTGVRQARHLREMLAGRDVRVVSLSRDDYTV